MLSWDMRFRATAGIATLLERYSSDSGRKLIGFRAPRGLLSEIRVSEVPNLFRPEVGRNTHEFLFGDPPVSLRIYWEDSDFVEATDSSHRLTAMLRMQDTEWDVAREQLLLLCQLTGAVGAELNETPVTGFVTFSGLNQHRASLPRFGSLNYLGPDYTTYLGLRRIRHAAFTQVEPWHDGVLTTIRVDTADAFRERQRSVECELGGEPVFKDWRPDNAPTFASREQHVGRFRSQLPMEFSITATGLKKRLSRGGST